MNSPTARRTLWLFAALTIYVAAQAIWWAVLLLRRDVEIAALRATSGIPPSAGDPSRRVLMVLGEAGVFLFLMLTLLVLVYRSVRRDLRMAGAQRNFLLAVTHELRSPIAAIKLQLHTLARPGIKPEQVTQLQRDAVQEADRLALLTEKVLLATAAGETSVRLVRERADLVQLVRSIVRRAQDHYAREHRIVVIAPDSFRPLIDAQAVRSIVDNLLENAAKYSPAGSVITVELRTGNGTWQLIVSDEGPGVPPNERERVFDLFHRSGSEEVRSTQGTGLGLYIVKRLVERSGGRIELGGRAPHGAIFTATFPDP
jgi:signal transduction histidine kinase